MSISEYLTPERVPRHLFPGDVPNYLTPDDIDQVLTAPYSVKSFIPIEVQHIFVPSKVIRTLVTY